MRDIEILLVERVNASRSIFHRKLVLTQESEDSKQAYEGRYIGHDASSGEDLIELNGEVVRARAISNSASSYGTKASIVIPSDKSGAITDRTPYR